MKVDKISISFGAELGDAVREAAHQSGKGLSGWLAEAASAKLRAEALDDFFAQWESRHGQFTEGEIEQATQSLQLPQHSRRERSAS
jgi:hypothetical protein